MNHVGSIQELRNVLNSSVQKHDCQNRDTVVNGSNFMNGGRAIWCLQHHSNKQTLHSTRDKSSFLQRRLRCRCKVVMLKLRSQSIESSTGRDEMPVVLKDAVAGRPLLHIETTHVKARRPFSNIVNQ